MQSMNVKLDTRQVEIVVDDDNLSKCPSIPNEGVRTLNNSKSVPLMARLIHVPT